MIAREGTVGRIMLLKFESARYETWFNPELVVKVEYVKGNGEMRIYFPDGSFLRRDVNPDQFDEWIDRIDEARHPIPVEVQNFPEPVEGQVSR